MSESSPEFVTVEMRGLKAALMARVKAECSSISVVVRRAVMRELGQEDSVESGSALPGSSVVKVSIRLSADEAELLARNARRARLGRGVYVARLMAGGASVGSGEERVRLLAALSMSNAELSNLSHALFTVASLLRRADVAGALMYRDTLLTIDSVVKHHLGLAATLLAECRSFRRGAVFAPAVRSRRPSS